MPKTRLLRVARDANFVRKAGGWCRSSVRVEMGGAATQNPHFSQRTRETGHPHSGSSPALIRMAEGRLMNPRLNPKSFLAMALLITVAGVCVVDRREARAGEVSPPPGYKVLEPIRHGNLTVFPVVAAKSYPTGEFMTLDEGLRSGEVVVTEAGNVQGLIRRHPTPAIRSEGAQVNRLVLVNNSKRPLLLLAGEIVTGGKQDRVIGKDRIVPAESDPVDLSVFCVEPGRWVAASEHFGASEAMYGTAVGGATPHPQPPMAMMAQPSVRAKAMAEKDQNQVWDEVRKQREAVTVEMAAAAPSVPTDVAHTSSYARLMENEEVRKQVDAVAKPIEQNYQSLIRQLRDRNAVGVVVAVNGRII